MAIQGSPAFPRRPIAVPPLLLLLISAAFVAIYVTLNIRADKISHLAISLVFLCATWSSLWDKQAQLKLRSDRVSLGLGLLLWVGVLSIARISSSSLVLSFFPLGVALGLILVASGWLGFRQYQPELLILSCLAIPGVLLRFLPDISPITAYFSTFLLWYGGFSVQLHQNYILLPQGGVQVVPSCSGLNLITYMVAITVVFC